MISKLNLNNEQVRRGRAFQAEGTVCVRPRAKKELVWRRQGKVGVAEVERGHMGSGQTGQGLKMDPKRFGRARRI